MRILLVEDNPYDAEAVRRIVSGISPVAEVITASGGKEALFYLLGEDPVGPMERPLIVLLDLGLYPVSGRDVLEILGDMHEMPGLALFVLTASEDPEDRAGARSHHVDGYITKQELSDRGAKLASLLEATWSRLTEERAP